MDTDNIETCLFYPRLTESTFPAPAYTLYRVKHSRKTKRVNAGGEMVLKRVEVFRIYKSDLIQAAAPDPKVKDKITDSFGKTWIVIDGVDIIGQGQEFICHCQQVVEQ